MDRKLTEASRWQSLVGCAGVRVKAPGGTRQDFFHSGSSCFNVRDLMLFDWCIKNGYTVSSIDDADYLRCHLENTKPVLDERAQKRQREAAERLYSALENIASIVLTEAITRQPVDKEDVLKQLESIVSRF